MATIVVRLVMTTDARRIIGSLIDGCGLYLFANVLLYAAGMQSPTASNRIGGLVESTGFVRTVFPLSWSINIPPIIAAVYIASSLFLLREAGWPRRTVRLIFLLAAVFVLLGAGTRVPMAIAFVLAAAVACFPLITRWIAQVATLLAAVSAFVLPAIIGSIQFIVGPLMSLIPGRKYDAELIGSLNGRDYIWDRSISFWLEWVSDLSSILVGFGVNGQYKSGASLTYREWIASIVRNPELAYVHNSFLQQLFDGGVLGWLLLVIAIYWTSVRLSRRRIAWGYLGISAIVALAVLLLCGMTEVAIAPGAAQESFWLLVVLVGVACQWDGSAADGGAAKADDDLQAQGNSMPR
ncbi:O-antigen ligase family protein [Mycolicibacterium austroafricanum]|uniref:O-antigen ligase family protein n=1 Tax=Mycolicibacterium austroafricanum TaxID=39687 RepID=UPI00130E563E|nr:O-antigen ligase family protein [Mycolicibacterium austroafricanum]QZY47748.1 O-antigen ligase family protein [Mycolicibacterium austroafricanum]